MKTTPQTREADLGAIFRRARIMKRLTQAELASAADLSLTVVRNLESGSGVQLASFLRVAQILDLAEPMARALLGAVPPETSPLRMLARARREPSGSKRVRHAKEQESSSSAERDAPPKAPSARGPR